MSPTGHRKQVRHYDEPGQGHALTFSCYDRRPLLLCDERRRLVSAGIDAAVRRLGFRLVAFVYMPEHLHLLVWAAEPQAQVSELLYAIKRPVSFRIKQRLIEDRDPLLDELTIRDRPGKTTFRFWQEGPGYDRNILTPEPMVDEAEYHHANPVRRKLCASPADYRWSSWRHYHRPHEPPDPDLPRVDGFPG